MHAATHSPKFGITLPIFDVDASEAIRVAVEAEEKRLDGIFVFDHLAPPGRSTQRKGLECFSLLGAVAQATQSASIGALVAKSWLRPPAVTAQAFSTLERISGGRVIAGVGISDRLSRGEIDAFQLDFPDRTTRIRMAEETLARIKQKGISRIWVGGASSALIKASVPYVECINLWNARPEKVSSVARSIREISQAEGRGEIPGLSWGGDLSFVEESKDLVKRLLTQGVEFVVISVPTPGDFRRAVEVVDSARAG